MKLSQPKKLSRPKFKFKMGVYVRGFFFLSRIMWFFSVGVYFIDPIFCAHNCLGVVFDVLSDLSYF